MAELKPWKTILLERLELLVMDARHISTHLAEDTYTINDLTDLKGMLLIVRTALDEYLKDLKLAQASWREK